jgi:hypothetical protein
MPLEEGDVAWIVAEDNFLGGRYPHFVVFYFEGTTDDGGRIRLLVVRERESRFPAILVDGEGVPHRLEENDLDTGEGQERDSPFSGGECESFREVVDVDLLHGSFPVGGWFFV